MMRLGLGILALAACLAGGGCTKAKPAMASTKPDEVLVTLPTTDEVTDFEEFIGHVDSIYAVDVTARVTGYLDQANFNDGDEVEKGALLFTIDPRTYKATFDQTKAQVEQGQAHLARTTNDHKRADALLQRNAIGREEYDRIQGDFAESKASVGMATAMLDTAQLNLDWTKVTAPISGRLSRRMVDPGNLVKADSTLLTTIVSLDPMYVNFDIDERTILKLRRLIAEGRVKSRTEAELPVYVGLSDEEGFPHKGIINFSDNKIDAATGTLRVRGTLQNPKPRLLSPGMFARIRLPVGVPHKSILISEEAIGTDQGRKFVFVAKKAKVKDVDKVTKKATGEHEGDVIESRTVKLGALNKGQRVVNEGLALTDRVVISGLQRVRPGKEVTAHTPEESAKAAAAALAKSATPVASGGGPPPMPNTAPATTPAPAPAESKSAK